MITWVSERVPLGVLRIGVSGTVLAMLTVMAVAQSGGSSTGGASGTATSQGNTAGAGAGQVSGEGSTRSTKNGVAGTGMGGTGSDFQSATPGPTSGTGQSVQRPDPNGATQP